MRRWSEEKAARVSQVPRSGGFGQVHSAQTQASVSLHLAAPEAALSMERILREQPEPGARRPPARQAQFSLASCPEAKLGTRRGCGSGCADPGLHTSCQVST